MQEYIWGSGFLMQEKNDTFKLYLNKFRSNLLARCWSEFKNYSSCLNRGHKKSHNNVKPHIANA